LQTVSPFDLADRVKDAGVVLRLAGAAEQEQGDNREAGGDHRRRGVNAPE
jgi:hypothetical protein